MTDTTETAAAEAVEVESEATVDQSTADGGTEPEIEGAEALGDPGKKALDTMKAAKKAAEQRARDLETQFAEFKAKAEGREAEFKADQERRSIEAEALSKANTRIKKAEIRAAAAGRLNDPADALRYLDLDEFEVGEDGEVDTSAVQEAIERLISTKPYLAVAQGTRFQGNADQGARKADHKSEEQQLEESLKTAPPAQRIAIRQRLAAIKADEAANR
jgi:hypothetical protein